MGLLDIPNFRFAGDIFNWGRDLVSPPPSATVVQPGQTVQLNGEPWKNTFKGRRFVETDPKTGLQRITWGGVGPNSPAGISGDGRPPAARSTDEFEKAEAARERGQMRTDLRGLRNDILQNQRGNLLIQEQGAGERARTQAQALLESARIQAQAGTETANIGARSNLDVAAIRRDTEKEGLASTERIEGGRLGLLYAQLQQQTQNLQDSRADARYYFDRKLAAEEAFEERRRRDGYLQFGLQALASSAQMF